MFEIILFFFAELNDLYINYYMILNLGIALYFIFGRQVKNRSRGLIREDIENFILRVS